MLSTERQTWLAARRSGIGSSDASAVVGVNPYRQRLEVYLDKIGQLPEEEIGPDDPRWWGIKDEAAIAAAYEHRCGCKLGLPVLDPDGIIRHPEHDWMLCTPDRQVEGERRLVEIKEATTFARGEWGEQGTDDVPDGYMIQVQHQLACTEFPLADVAVRIGQCDFRIYHIERNERLISWLIDQESKFWVRIQRREPPEPEFGNEKTAELLLALYGISDRTLQLGTEALQLVAQYEALGREAKAASETRQAVKQQLLQAMRDASRAILPDGREITRRQINRKGYTVEPSTYWDFRIKKARVSV